MMMGPPSASEGQQRAALRVLHRSAPPCRLGSDCDSESDCDGSDGDDMPGFGDNGSHDGDASSDGEDDDGFSSDDCGVEEDDPDELGEEDVFSALWGNLPHLDVEKDGEQQRETDGSPQPDEEEMPMRCAPCGGAMGDVSAGALVKERVSCV